MGISNASLQHDLRESYDRTVCCQIDSIECEKDQINPKNKKIATQRSHHKSHSSGPHYHAPAAGSAGT
jgi:hypothetical protein